MWNWDRKTQGLIAVLAAALIFACGIKYARWQANRAQMEEVVIAAEEGEGDSEENSQAQAKMLGVHVAGAVSKPGVYYLPQGARVVDAVQKAGYLPQADIDSLSLAQPLTDGEKIYVPRQGEVLQTSDAGGIVFGGNTAGLSGGLSSGKVNLNTASAEELDARLPGIGPVFAQRIVDYRNSHGPFRSLEDLQNVSGIGPRRFEQIKDLVTI